MLKNKIIVKKIRNIFILLMAIIIMLGAYQNIRNSKAENVIQIEMEVSDKSNILSAQTITVDATETSDGNYLLTLPTSVNKNIVTKYYTSSGEEILVDADNNISTIQLTEEEVANKKVQVQSDYDTKEVTVNNQTKLLYNKELQELPNESGTGSQDVIVTGYMPLDVDIEVKEMDLATLTSVKLPSENQTMQKAYEISIFEVVEKQGTETNTTNDVQTQTMEDGAQNTDSTQQDVATQVDVEPQSEVAEQATTQTENTETERVEYDSSVYGEKIIVKTKQAQTNAIKTYTLAEDNQVTEVVNVTSGGYVDFESDKGGKTLKYIIATEENENEAEENISLMSEDINSDIATYASSSSTLKSASSETSASSAFLGSTNIQRQNIESVTFNSTTTDATMPKGLIRSFNGASHSGSTWTDLTENKNGAVKGGSWGSDGNGSYLSLNGTASQWVNLERMEMLLKEQVTLDVIIKVSSNTQTSVILGNVDDGGMEIALNAGKPRFSIWFENDTSYTRIDASSTIVANKSTRITGTYNGTTMALYVDGVLVGTKTKQNGIVHSPVNNTVMAIGCNPIGSSSQQDYFNGKIYSARIYNKGLMQGEVTQGWNSSEPGVLSGLIRAMDGNYNTKGTGHKTNATTWYDLTGNQNGAIMNGAQTAHTSSTVNGRWGNNYFEFNGSTDWVNLGQIDTSITNKITLDAIVEVSDNTQTYGIVSNVDDGGLEICLSKGKPRLNLWFEGDTGYTRITDTNTIAVNTPTRITGTFDGTTMALYVNGELVGTQTKQNGTIHKPVNNTVMAIGCNPTGSSGQGYYLKGKVYSAKVYNKGLSQSQIQQIWDVSAAGDNSILAWRTQTGPYKVNIGSYNNIYANSDSSYLFSYIGYGSACTETSVINGIGLLNTSSATNMEGMFQYCGYRKMTGLSLGSNFYTSNVTNMSNMFNGCGQTQLTSFDFGSNFNTSRVTNMSGMFQNFAYKLGSLNLGSQFYTSAVTNMSNMFSGCGQTELTTFSLGSNFNTARVTNMSGMFQNFAPKLVSLNLGTQFYTSAVTDMSNMFYNCGTTAMTSLDLGPAFTRIASSYDDFATNCGKSGSITIYTGSAIYSNSNAFRLGANSSVTIGLSRGTINPKYKPEWSIQSYSVSGSSLVLTLKGNVNTTNYTGDSIKTVTNRFTNGSTNSVRAKVDGDSSANSTITKTISNASSTTAQTVTCTLTLGNFAESTRQSGKNFLEWSGNVSLDFIPTTIEDAYGNPNLLQEDGTTIFTDVIKPEFTYEYTNTTIDHGTKTVTIVFDVADKYFSSSALSTDSSASNIDVVVGGVTATNATKTLTKVQDLSTTINGTSKKTGERYRLVITNLDQGGGNDYSGIMTLAFPADIITDMSTNGNLAKTITIGIDDPTTGDGDDTGVIVDVVDPIWKVENINIDKTNKKVTADLIATDKYLTGVENSTLTTNDITVSVDDDVNANTVITKSLTEPTFSTNETTGMKEIKYTLTLDNFEQATKQTGKSFLEYSGTVKITVAAGTITDDTSGEGGGNGVSPSTLYDAAGTNANGLHIGDFVNYDAGTWTQEEINAIQTGEKTNLQTANGSTSLPTNTFQFGGFTAGESRNGNATPYSSSYNYIKEETGNAVTGWRVYDIEGDTVTLISAGNPEDYYHPYGTDNGYISEYILTGNVNTSWSGADTSLYQKRNWSNYVNVGQKAISATVLTKSELDRWYSKYTDAGSGANTDTDSTFQKIYSEPYIKYQSIIDNYSYYWLSAVYISDFVYYFYPYSRYVFYNNFSNAFGVRVLVSLSSNVKFSANRVDTKTLSGGNMTTYGGEQTYNCWDIVEGTGDSGSSSGTRTDGHSNTSKEQEFELGHVDFIKPRIEKESATKDETAKTETIILNVMDKYLDTTDALENSEITVYIDGENVTGLTKTLSKNTRTTATTSGGVTYETNGDITAIVNGTSQIVGQQYKLVLSDFEQATNNSKKYKDWSGTVSIDVAEGAVKDQISASTANTSDAVTVKGDFVDFIAPYLTYQYLTTDIDREGTDADGKSFQMAFEVTDKYYESGKLSIDDLSIQIADGKNTYDLKNTPVTIALNSDESITAPNVKMTNKTTGEVETVTSTTIGHRYVLTISNLEQLEIAEGNTTLDYSGIVTVAVDANKISDRTGNTNIAKTITSGVSIPDETGDGVVVDVVKPIWRKTSDGSIDFGTKTANIVVKGTDTYYASNSLTVAKLRVYAYSGTTQTDITSSVNPTLSAATRLDESVTVNGTTSTRQYGVQYTITLTNIPVDKDQVKIIIPADTLTDQSGNTNDVYEIKLFATLKSAVISRDEYGNVDSGEKYGDSGFLGNSSIQRRNIESVTFLTSASGAANNKWDVSAAQDGSIWAWYTGSGPYQVYIGSDEFMCANQDSGYLFSHIGSGSNSTATNVINGLEYLNTVTATNMNGMFSGCGYTSMTSLDLGDKFDTSNVTDMREMFYECGYTAMTSLVLGEKFDTSKVTNMRQMFYNCGREALRSLSLGEKFNTSNVTNMNSMFPACGLTTLTSLDLGDKFDTSNVTDMSDMFSGLTALPILDLGDKFNTSNVTNMSNMFSGLTALTSLDLGDKFDTSNVTNHGKMFAGCTAITTLDLGPKFTKIASDENSGFMTNCGTTGAVIYAPEAIYKDRTSFKLNSGDTSTASGAIPVDAGRTINPIYKPEWEKVSSSLDTTTNPENPTISVVVKGSANKSETINGVNINYNSQVTSGLTKDNISVYIDGELDGDTNKNGIIDAGETPSITKTVTSASPSATSAEVTHTITLSGLEEALRQNGKSFKEWSGNIAIKIGGRGEATDTYTANVLTDEYGNQSMMETDASGTWIDVLYKDTDTDHNVNGTMFADFVKPEFTYEYSNTTINHETKTVTIVFDVTDKYFNSSALLTDTTASNIDVVVGGTTPTNATKALTKLQDLTATVNGTSKKVGERYQLVITNLDQGGGNDYSGIMTLAFPADIITDMSTNGNLAKTITIGIDDPTTGDGDDTGVIVDVVDPIWKVENINIDKTNKKVTADLIATDKYLTGVENSTLTTNDITVSVDDDVNANTVITKSLTEPTFSTNETTGMKEIKYTLTLDNFEQATKQTGKSFLEYSGNVKIKIAAGTVTDDASAIGGSTTQKQSNTNKEKTFELGHVDFIKPRIEKQSATKDETAKTETIIINVIDKYIDTTKEITADEITIYADEEIVTGITKTFSKNTRTTPATEEDLRYETNGNITTTINGTSKVIGQQYKLVLSDFEQATNNSKKYKDWSGTISIDVAEGAVKDQISGTTANTNELTTLKGDFVDFITPYLTYQYLTTDIDRTGADADGKSFQMAFEVTDKYYESGKLSIDDLSIQIADGKNTYDLKNTPVTIALNSDESITAPNVKMTNKTTGEVETVTSTTIGHRYVLTISNLEQLEIAEGNTTLDYSGIVTVAVDANKISDRTGNTNIAKTITSGVSIPDETGDGVVVDVVKPIWRRTTGGSLDLTTKTASLVVKGTDTYYASNSLTAGKIKVYAYTGTTPTDITSLVSPALSTATRLDESVTVDGVTSTRQYGVQYTITLTGIPIDKDQVKVVIPAGTLTDQSGNTNEEYETRLFTTLQSAAGETAATSAFLGNSSIQRQNIESVTFVSGIEGAANNKWDVSAAQDGSIWAWYTGSGPYQVYIGSDEFMCANQDSRYLFSYIGYASNSTATNVINGLEYLNIITATNMSYMFNYCGYQKMTSLNLGNNFDTTNVTNMAGMFQNCGQTKMTSINLGTQFYTSKVTDMSNMFNGCGQTELITFSLGSNFDTTKVTNMSGMFQNFAHKLGILNLGTQFYTSEVTDMSNMFNGCGQNAMTTLTLGTNFDTTKVTNMSQMFKDFAKSSTGMTSLDLGDSFYTTSITDMTRMFNGCGQTAMVALDLGPAFTKIASANTDFATNCGASGIVIYAPESIYSNRTSFKLNKTGQ